jgi:hypothetical protein
MTLLFEAVPEPALPLWQRHSTDLDLPRTDHLDYLTYLRLDICPRCLEDAGSAHCTCDWSAIAAVEQAGTPEIHIDMKGRDGG